MKTEIQPITPEAAGLTLAVLSGPRGSVQAQDGPKPASYLEASPKGAGWPCIEYTCQLSNARRQVVWTGEYRLGVGHVKWPAGHALNLRFHSSTAGLTAEEENVCRIHARGQRIKQTPEGLAIEASAAAKLAKKQKVTPKLTDVCASLLSDGAAFFDGERFEDWCANFGYDTDSRKAEATWRACDDIGRALSRHLSRDELAGLREWASNY